MVTTAVFIDTRCATELGTHDDHGGVKQTCASKIGDQCGESLIHCATCFGHRVINVVVHVPTTGNNFNEADAVLDQATSKETAATELAWAIHFLGSCVFLTEVEGL